MEIKVIHTREQYDSYCDLLEKLTDESREKNQDKIELLTVLIEKWDIDHNTFDDAGDPIELLSLLMKEHKLKAGNLAQILDLSKGTISKMLNYQKGLSKRTIRKLSNHFKISQEAFNRPYDLVEKKSEKRSVATSS